MPVEPPPSRWRLPDPARPTAGEVAGIGADLEPGTLLAAYRAGLFPMGTGAVGREGVLAWWSPDPRAVLPLDGLVVSRSLRRSIRRYEIRIDTAFDAVVEACAAPDRPGAWITPDLRRAYGVLHSLGWAHSVESWAEGRLVGGLYGVAIGGLFAGESMFSAAPDASKAALAALVRELLADGGRHRLVDVQWQTPHLASLGCVELPRAGYLAALRLALRRPLPAVFGEASASDRAGR